MSSGDRPGERATAGWLGPGTADRAVSTAEAAGWLVMGSFLLAALLTVLTSVSPEVYQNVFLGLIVPGAVLALVAGLLVVARSV
jgi:hypothetical protein